MKIGSPRNRKPGSGWIPCLLALLAGAAATAGAQDGLPLSDGHTAWLEEEVVYIISNRERDAFERLQSEAEREAFIAAFWRRRDPEPLTPENEYRIEHYERVAYANERLGRESATPGWMTDRGRTYIKLGPPDEVETFSSIPGLYQTELWFYLAQEEMLLPPLYFLFFREYNAGPFIQYNHVIHLPEELLPAQSFTAEDSRMEAYVFLQEMSPQLAHAAITMRADRGVQASLLQPDMEQLQTQSLLLDIERAPFRLLDTGWVTGAETARGLVESEYLFNFVPSAGVARVLPGPAGGGADPTWFAHYAIEIEPQHFTVAREEDGNEYFTRFDLQGEVTTPDGELVHDFTATPFLRLSESELTRVGARPFTYRGMFPLIPGAFRFRLIFKNDARTEYTVFEEELLVPEGDGPFLSRPLLLHGVPDPEGDPDRAWATAAGRVIPNGPGVGALGAPLTAAVSARGHATARFRLHRWSAEAGQEPGPALMEEDAPVTDGLAIWRPATDSLDSGRYLLSAVAGDQERSTVVELNARGSVPLPWGLTDSYDMDAAGAAPALLGEQWLRIGAHAEARQAFETALAENPNLGRARLILGRFALDEGDPRQAARLLEPALAQSPGDPRILRVLGDAHRESGNPSRAADLYERSLSLEAPDAGLLAALGWSLAAAGEPARAIPYLRQSLDLAPEQPELRELLVSLTRPLSPPRD